MSCFANGSAVGLFYCEEDVDGNISATVPVFKPIRFVSAGFSPETTQIDSNEIRPDRQRPVSRQGTYSVLGNIAGELSFSAHDDLIEAAMQGTWTADVLKVGSVRRSFAILERHTDKSLDYIYRGCEIGGMAIAAPLGAAVSITFPVMGKEAEEYTVPVGATFDARTATDIMVTTEGYLEENAVPVAYATNVNINLDNGMTADFALFSRSAFCISNGIAVVNGDVSFYLVDGVLYGKFLNETPTAIEVQFTDGTDTYTINMPKVLYTTGSKETSGPNAIIPQLNFSAGYDTVAASTIVITRS